jgi:hypothetical protein
MILIALIITNLGGYFAARPCNQLEHLLKTANRTLTLFPDCEPYFSGQNPEIRAVVRASMRGNVAEISAALGLSFGAALWLAILLHAIVVEVYVSAVFLEIVYRYTY